MSLLSAHLEQISISCQGIDSLPYVLTPTQRAGAGEVDIEVLLHGAEKLCAVYPLRGALERIPEMRGKYAQQSGMLRYYEGKVAEQVERMEAQRDGGKGEDEDGDETP
ncbi:hypothetical protein N0V88_005688 [Collariella sp. IMI 366227]|nr:hypothetical protein N0V88_005688 [Collariella sp. IMI 366227]